MHISPEQEVATIEETLVSLLHEITRIDTGAVAPVQGGYPALPPRRPWTQFPDDTSAQRAARFLARSPIREACAASATVLVERLIEISGTEAVKLSLDRIVKHAEPRHRPRWRSMLDDAQSAVPGRAGRP
jgi:hypothetical protein